MLTRFEPLGSLPSRLNRFTFWKGIYCSNFRLSCDLFTKRSSNNLSTMRQREISCRGRLGVPTTRLFLGKFWSYGRVVAHGHLIVLGFTLGQTAVAEVTGAMLASQLGLFDRASVSSPNSGADLGYILTDFLNDSLWTELFTGYLNERRRRNIRGGCFGECSPRKFPGCLNLSDRILANSILLW